GLHHLVQSDLKDQHGIGRDLIEQPGFTVGQVWADTESSHPAFSHPLNAVSQTGGMHSPAPAQIELVIGNVPNVLALVEEEIIPDTDDVSALSEQPGAKLEVLNFHAFRHCASPNVSPPRAAPDRSRWVAALDFRF